MVNKERLTLGLEALRSGEYIQGRGALKMQDSAGRIKHCCLGVLTEVAIANGCEGVRLKSTDSVVFQKLEVLEPEDGPEYEDWDDEEDGTLVPSVAEWYGFERQQSWQTYGADPYLIIKCGAKRTATDINDDVDDVSDFHVIADAFERTFLHGH